MLTRAARRHLRRGIHYNILADYNQLALPFLCPAVAPSVAKRSARPTSTATPSSPRRISRSPGRHKSEIRSQSRHLATAAEPSLHGTGFDYIPFDAARLPSQPNHTQSLLDPSRQPLSELRRRDVSNPANLAILPDRMPGMQSLRVSSRASISGDIAELQQNVYACVQVGRMDRAASLIRFMNKTLKPNTPELHDVHLRYFSGLMDAMLKSPAKDKLSLMQKWLELDMKVHGIPVGYQILSYVLKSSFLALSGPRLDRTLRRYLTWAEETSEDELQAILSDRIFTDKEWRKLLNVCKRSSESEGFDPEVEIAEGSYEEALPGEDLDIISDLDGSPRKTSAESPVASMDVSQTLRPTDQKGLGLSSLRASLVSLQSHSIEDFEVEEGKDPRMALQERLENDVLDAALQRWREESAQAKYDRAQGRLSSPGLGAYVSQWVDDISAALDAEIKRADELLETGNDTRDDMDLLLVTPFLKMMNVEKAVAAAILSFMESTMEQEMKWARQTKTQNIPLSKAAPLKTVLADIGRAIMKEAHAERLLESHKLEKLSKMPSAGRQKLVSKLRRNQRREQKAALEAGDVESLKSDLDIAPTLRYRTAAFLLMIILREAKLPVKVNDPETNQLKTEMQPVGKHALLYWNGKRHGAVEMNRELSDRLKKEPPVGMIAKYLPMLCPPRPWTGLKEGGYLTSKTDIVRFKENNMSSLAYLKLADQRGDLKQVYAALDGLGQVPWRINRGIFDVMTKVWNTGQKFSKIAPLSPEVELPAEPDPADPTARFRWRYLVRMAENQMSSYHSQRCFQNFQLEVARAFLNDEFYCPHNVDFRGRAYPLPPYLNHMGPDYIRALFTFSKGKELGERGLFWLKVHLANVSGFDKATLEERAQFADDHIGEIYDSAENPLDGQQWWRQGDDPWQCLAACMELRAALESPIPAKYVSSMPVQQDGSCNGLQHYAALGGDQLGAEQVNLEPGERPGDVYAGVLNMVKKAVAEDAAKGDKLAQVVNGRLTRKCVKQPVMTNVYGVTFVGATQQVRKQLVNVIPREEIDSGKANLNEVCAYVTRLIFKSLRRMFSGAHAIQDWFGECGARISRAITPEQLERLQAKRSGAASATETSSSGSRRTKMAQLSAQEIEDCQFKSSIVWTTPLGMPVVQPYRDQQTRTIETSLQSLKVPMDSLSDAVNKRRQLQGFPPNFVHSLDATHMMLTSLKFRELGMTFAAIHDGFWTHATDVDVLNTELRDAFVRMHGEDIIGRLREELTARYAGCLYWVSVSEKSPAGQKIRAYYAKHRKGGMSRYRKSTINSTVTMDDALLEKERQRLLASEDVEDFEKGRQMVTPASLFEEAAAPEEQMRIDLDEAEQSEPANDDPAAETNLAEADSAATLAEAGIDHLPTVATAGDANSANEPEPKSQLPKRPVPRSDRKIFFWRPMTFPTAPAKGTFDVERVRMSKYFFS